ncbi:MAG: phosphoribosylglycinamide formyltransferase [Deltaproteobacteria bacterium]|jgi:phosphoribosylglycinamide formyltransferase-1|nr:phosphoribosylglycinamide formyltransferase [Deltaproteobacteria bacterium]
MNIAVLCSGRGSNLLALLKAQNQGSFGTSKITLVATENSQAGALKIAEEHGIKTFFKDNYNAKNRLVFREEDFLEYFAGKDFGLIVLAGFQKVLSPKFIALFPQRILNVHPALLPAFPGHKVWSGEVAYGIKVAGATVHFIDEGVDTGPIVIQGGVPVLDTDDADTLSARILRVEHQILPQAVAWYVQGRIQISGRIVKITGTDFSEKSLSETLIWPPLGA